MRITLMFAVSVLISSRLPGQEETTDGKTDDRPRVLLLGDSISIGYTPHVQKLLEAEAVVIRPTRTNRKTNKIASENCAGTNNGVKNIDRWLAHEGGKWNVIHFNFGLHDLKRVNPETGANSNKPDDPRQADPDRYRKQLIEIVGKLKQTGAKLIFATTTPYPQGVKPHRSVEDAILYNDIAREIMENNDIAIDDLYSFALPRLEEIQRPANVHFLPEGSKLLGEQVVEKIRQALKSNKN